MDGNIDNLKRLVENLKSIGFWSRLFSWGKIKNDLIDASSDLQKLISNTDNLKENIAKLEAGNIGLVKDVQLKAEYLAKRDAEIESLRSSNQDLNNKISDHNASLSAAETKIKGQEGQIAQLSSDNKVLVEKNSQLLSENKRLVENSGISGQTISDLTKRKNELEIEFSALKRDFQNAQSELSELKKQNTQLNKDEEFRKNEHSNTLATLTRIQDQIKADREREIEDRNTEKINYVRNLKETWSKHQESSKNIIKSICQKHTIGYIEKVPFKGDPDNTLEICEEYVVFDAKSPGSDDLSNFPNYLKDQAEKAKKYAKQENVKSDIFFVVPSNTLEYLNVFVYRHGDHNVFIISVDALEPIILGLKKIEEYEFAEQLSPEDREHICRILGRFAHLSKRRIQVDNFFAKQFIELAYKCEIDLPKDILASVIDFERSEKLNPPLEKRAKAIPIAELEKESKTVKQEADGRGIVIEDETISNSLNELPLYKDANKLQ